MPLLKLVEKQGIPSLTIFQSRLGGFYVCLNRQRARENACANFVYCLDEKIDNMNVEDLRIYEKNCHNGWQDLILHEEEGTGTVCVNDLRVQLF